KFRDEAHEWGWCKDEFTESNHLPMQLYVREARRVTGQYVFTEKDTDCAPEDARAVLHPDAIAMGDYGPNCHGTWHEGSRFGGRHGLAPTPAKPGERGKNIFSQYYEAFPSHATELDKPLDAALAERWQKIAGNLGLDAAQLPKVDGKTTRGAWLRAAWAARPS